MLTTCSRHVPVYCTCCAPYGIMTLQKRRWRTFSEQLWWRRYCTVLQHGPAFVQRLIEWKLMRSYEDATDPVTVNWAYLQWLNCLLTLMTRTFNVYCQTKTVLQTFLPERQAPAYSLRVKTHNKPLIDKTANLNEHNFLIRLSYKDCYWLL